MGFVERIHERSLSLRVVGVGHVGLALALTLVETGFAVYAVERSATRRARLLAGDPELRGEPHLAERLAAALHDKRLTIAALDAPGPRADIALICVATPMDAAGLPDLRAVNAATAEAARHLADDGILVVESTLPCGTMRALSIQITVPSARRLAHVPERVMPGKMLENLTNMPRTIGVNDAKTANELHAFYSIFVRAPLRVTSWEVAELTKTSENALRDINIAFANTLARICEEQGVAFDDVACGILDVPGRTLLRPGLVAGTCLPKDTQLLRAASQPASALLDIARATNDETFTHVVDEVMRLLRNAGVNPSQATVALLGISYAPGIGAREGSPTPRLMQLLQSRGVSVRSHDPYLSAPHAETALLADTSAADLTSALRGSDLALVVTPHPAYRAASARQWSTMLRSKLVYCICSLGQEWAAGSDLAVHVLGHGHARGSASSHPTGIGS